MACKRPRPKDDQNSTESDDNRHLGAVAAKRSKPIDSRSFLTSQVADTVTDTPTRAPHQDIISYPAGDESSNRINLQRGTLSENSDPGKMKGTLKKLTHRGGGQNLSQSATAAMPDSFWCVWRSMLAACVVWALVECCWTPSSDHGYTELSVMLPHYQLCDSLVKLHGPPRKRRNALDGEWVLRHLVFQTRRVYCTCKFHMHVYLA